MKFSLQEMIFMNSVAKGPSPFALELPLPKSNEKEAMIENTFKSLQDKEILDADRKLTAAGIVPIQIFEQYKNAKEHILLNRMRICRTNNPTLIVIAPGETEYEMAAVHPAILLEILLRKISYMCGAQDKSAQPFPEVQIAYDIWSQDIRAFGDQNLFAGTYTGQQPVTQKAYYWNQNQGFVYDINTHMQRQLHPREMRMELMHLLGSFETQEVSA